MASTIFTDQVTTVYSSWLNDVNNATYVTLPTKAASGANTDITSLSNVTVPLQANGTANGTIASTQFVANAITIGGGGSTGGSGATGAGQDRIFVENDNYVTANWTIGQGGLTNCTISIASPGVITQTNSYLGGENVFLQTTGALPTGLSANTGYYVSSTGLNTTAFQVAATRGGASIATTGTQSGVQKCGKLKTAHLTGPLTVASNVSVTVPSGSRLVVL